MIFPTIHVNGTSAVNLANGYHDARLSLMESVRLLDQAAPNGRDYYPDGPDAILLAMADHADRLAWLARVIHELEDLEIYCLDYTPHQAQED